MSMAVDERLKAAARLARTQHAYARLLLDSNEPENAQRAHELLDQALTTAERLGMRRLLAQVKDTRGPRRVSSSPAAAAET
jgi:hypothetical protein